MTLPWRFVLMGETPASRPLLVLESADLVRVPTLMEGSLKRAPRVVAYPPVGGPLTVDHPDNFSRAVYCLLGLHITRESPNTVGPRLSVPGLEPISSLGVLSPALLPAHSAWVWFWLSETGAALERIKLEHIEFLPAKPLKGETLEDHLEIHTFLQSSLQKWLEEKLRKLPCS